MARRGRLLADLRISAPSVVARILAWARDATDFRPSINGVGGACATRRTVWESSREPWRDGPGCYRTLGFRLPDACTHIGVGARRDRFSTIDKRRCDCAAGRAQAGSVSASDGAPGQAVCRLPRFGNSPFNLHPLHAITNATLISAR